MRSYPLFLWVHISDAKVILLQQAVVITHMIQEKLSFSVSLERKEKSNEQKSKSEANLNQFQTGCYIGDLGSN